MPNELDPPAVARGSVVVSLVAVMACVLASPAHASRFPADPGASEQELSARIATIVERIRLGEPALVRDLPPEAKVAQWRNR
jgi:hypothetical protein